MSTDAAAQSSPCVADAAAVGYAKAMDEVIDDNCRMKDIYEPTTDDILDDMVKLTLRLDKRTITSFMRVHMFKDYSAGSPGLEEELSGVDTKDKYPKNARRLELSFDNTNNASVGLVFAEEVEHKNIWETVGWHVQKDYGWQLLSVVPTDSVPFDDDCFVFDDTHTFMMRYATTGVEFATNDSRLTIEPWSPCTTLEISAKTSAAASSLQTPPAQAGIGGNIGNPL